MPSDTYLRDQVAIVTGGGTGLGLSVARRLGELGARLVLASRNPEHLETGARSLADAGLEVLTAPTDVRDPGQVDAMVARAVERFGRVDILINNAAGNFICRAEDLSPNGWASVINIVLNGSFYCARAVGRHLIARKAPGSIVSILAHYVWTASPGTIHSAAAKSGVLSMTRTLALEWAQHGIRVNAVAPGPVYTEGAAKQLFPTPEIEERIRQMVPLRRWGRPEEIAEAVAYLVSPLAGYITGEVLTIDGGAWLGGSPFEFVS